ncbi:hypothetical protein EJ08DRAFT_654019 [Tothia fuscella]|uniref:Uncharacterized protein n=1 Tax=Tothia fuscella TaxID=1048955 RepID=A0A9P4TSV9_9PEZI|nr:hypothetical protein EJ08DRAFT_654019 [Tothia fuscella]
MENSNKGMTTEHIEFSPTPDAKNDNQLCTHERQARGDDHERSENEGEEIDTQARIKNLDWWGLGEEHHILLIWLSRKDRTSWSRRAFSCSNWS